MSAMAHIFLSYKAFISTLEQLFGDTPTFFFYPYLCEICRSQRFVPRLENDADGHYSFDREGEYLTDRLTDEPIAI